MKTDSLDILYVSLLNNLHLLIIYAVKFKWLSVILITPEEQLKIISRSPHPILNLESLDINELAKIKTSVNDFFN